MKNTDNEIKIVRPEDIQQQVEKIDRENYSNILNRVYSQLESARSNGSRSKVLACVDINILEIGTEVVRDVLTHVRNVGWKVGTRKIPFTHAGVFRVPDVEELHRNLDLHPKGLKGLRITVYHPSVPDHLVSNINEYKHTKGRE